MTFEENLKIVVYYDRKTPLRDYFGN